MLKRIWETSPVGCILFFLLLASDAATLYLDWRIGLIETLIIIIIAAVVLIRRNYFMSDINKNIAKISKLLDERNRVALIKFPLPVLVADDESNILWYNEKFKDDIIGGQEIHENGIQQFTSGIGVNKLDDFNMFTCEYNERMYSVWTSVVENENSRLHILYFFDDTEQKKLIRKYELSQPCVFLITIDNLDEIFKNIRESEKAEISGLIEKMLEDRIGKTNGFLKRLSGSRFLAILDEENLQKIREEKFSLLNTVRNHAFGEITGATLSIGVGRGETLTECEEKARQALDMALGRGGDQAVIKFGDSFEFFGGTSAGTEKRTKVKTRVVAKVLFELIQSSDRVYIMGHRFADYDAFGAAVGMWRIAQILNKEAHIVMTRNKSLAGMLVKRMEGQGLTDIIIEPEKALHDMTERSLLIITDTQRPDFVDSAEVYHKAKRVVVIDHHRKTVEHISNAVVFFHEPLASSASEMVTELLQYKEQTANVGKPVAEALLAGIMLDTHNFIMQTGVRTFEAAAFLKSCGADTVAVKQLFMNSIEEYQRKVDIVVNTEIYKECAIAITQHETEDIRIVAAQAADDLLTIEGIKASFVIFPNGNNIRISARSMGKLNVQLIMEALGGGGHYTMAATTLTDASPIEAKAMLIDAINNYYQNTDD